MMENDQGMLNKNSKIAFAQSSSDVAAIGNDVLRLRIHGKGFSSFHIIGNLHKTDNLESKD